MKYRVPIVKTSYGFVEVDAESEMDAISAVNNFVENGEIDELITETAIADYDVQEDDLEELEDD